MADDRRENVESSLGPANTTERTLAERLRACRHRKTWIIVGGHAEWCYQCGAWRPMYVKPPNVSTPAGAWTRPTGPNGENPATLEPTL